MSLQLIYTSSARLLDSAQAGYGTVARSEIMPKEMQRRLVLMSRYREQSGIVGPQYTYSTLGYAGQEYHVFTAVQSAGADYSGRSCFIAHHLVLIPEEIAALRRNDTRPTPAGILLALCNARFWCGSWSGEPRYLRHEPQLSREHLPEAESQPTWKRLTGHKGNARAFLSSPFERDCLLALPKGSSSEDVLRLLHEGDWLTPNCGWGKTFTTHADASDAFREHLRWACVDNSPLILKAMRTGHPVLPVNSELELNADTEGGDAGEPMLPTSTEFRAQLAARQAARMVPPYHYTEEPDVEIYALNARSLPTKYKWAAILTAGCLLTVGGIGTWYAAKPEKRPVVKVLNQGSAHRHLTRLLSAPYDAVSMEQSLREIEQMATTPLYAETELNRKVGEIVALLQQASDASRHVHHLNRLCRLAQEVQLNQGQLCLIYMLEATHNRPADDWVKSFSRDELKEWEQLLRSQPDLQQALAHPELVAYFDLIMSTPKEPVPDTPTEAPESAPKGALAAVSVGDVLPEELLSLIRAVPQSISQGDVKLVQLPCSGTDECSRNLQLSKQHCVMNIEQGATQDTVYLRFVNPEDMAQPPREELVLELRNNRLQGITAGGNPVAALLPVGNNSKVLLMPRLSIPLTGIHPPVLPPLSELDLSLCPDDIEVLPPTAEHMAASIGLKKRDTFPWTESGSKQKEQRFSFTLPQLLGPNVVLEPEIAENNPVSVRWNGICDTRPGKHYKTFTCAVTPYSAPGKRLMETFNCVANTCCAGEVSEGDPMYSLAMIYTTVNILHRADTNEKERASAGTRYCTLFSHKKFSELMQQVLPKNPELRLSYETATSRSASARDKSRRLIRRLNRPANCELIRQAILQYISHALRETYKAEQEQALQDVGIKLVLRSLRINEKEELEWSFLLQPVTAKDIASP